MNPLKVREDFPILERKINGKPLAYLDNAATTQKPRQVIMAMVDFYENHNANVHRGIHTLSEEATIAYDEAHAKAGSFIGASAEEIVFTRNATESLNILARSLTRGLQKGDEIVLSQMEHHSNLVPWQVAAAERGLKLKFLEIDREGHIKDFSPITRKAKIVSVTQMSNVIGTINPVKEIARAAHDNGAVCVVDGAQSVPHFPVDVQKLGIDFLAFSGHKMLGPTGIGVLYGRKELLEKMPPFLTGGGMISEVGFERSTFAEVPWKFEAGTPSIAEAIGLSAAMDYLKKLGMEEVFSHEKRLAELALDLLEAQGAAIQGPRKGRGGVVSFTLEGIHPHDVTTILDQDGIAIRGGHHCAMPLMGILGVEGTSRASFYIYNTKEEVERLAESAGNARKVFA